MSSDIFNFNKSILVSFLSLFIALNSNAQSASTGAINTAGGSTTHTDIIYEWSIGELAVIETMISDNQIITNGVLQPVSPGHFITEAFVVFPNNILTPNGDGKNDVWVIKDLERYPDNELTVFDRAGRIVYKTINYKNNWAGDMSGLPLSQDTYYYVLELRKDGKTGLAKGFITILN